MTRGAAGTVREGDIQKISCFGARTRVEAWFATNSVRWC